MSDRLVEAGMKLTLTFMTIKASIHLVSLLLNSQQLQKVTIEAVKTISRRPQPFISPLPRESWKEHLEPKDETDHGCSATGPSI